MCPSNFHSNDFHVICPKNKPFFAETLKAGKAVAEPPKRLSAKPIILPSDDGCPVSDACKTAQGRYWYFVEVALIETAIIKTRQTTSQINVENSGGATKSVVGKADAFVLSFDLPSTQGSPIIL